MGRPKGSKNKVRSEGWPTTENGRYKLRDLTREDVRDIIAHEGIGDAIREWIKPENVKDKELATLIRQAKMALRKVQDYVYTG